jgi:hypothetical protein
MIGYINTSFSYWAFHIFVLLACIGGFGGAMYGMGRFEKDKEAPEYNVSLVFSLILAVASGVAATYWFSKLELSKDCVNACNNFAKSVATSAAEAAKAAVKPTPTPTPAASPMGMVFPRV